MIKRLIVLMLALVLHTRVRAQVISGNGGGGGGPVAIASMPSTSVGFSGTPNFVCGTPVTATLFKMTLTGNVTAPTFDATCTAGLILGVELTQGTAGNTFTAPAGYDGCSIEPTINSVTTIVWDANGKRISCDSVLWTAVNAQTISYTALASDDGKLITENGASLTLTLPAAVPSVGWYVWVQNLNASALTVSRNGLTINGGTSNITLQQYQRVRIESDGANYKSEVPIVAGTNVTLTPASNGLTVTATGGAAPIISNARNFTFASGVTNELPIQFVGTGSNCASGSEQVCQAPAPRAGTIGNLVVVTNAAQPAACNLVITFRKNGANAGSPGNLAVTIAGGAAAGTFTDNTDTVSVVQGDLIDYQGVNGACTSATITGISVTYQ